MKADLGESGDKARIRVYNLTFGDSVWFKLFQR
jgi:hypothetical protein